MHCIFPALFALVSTAAFAETPYEARFVNHWSAQCHAPFGAYQLSFDSASGDPTEDDMTVSIKAAAGNGVRIPLKPALFVAGRLASGAPSQCDNVSTATLASGNILLLIQRDDRPLTERVSAVLLRAGDGAVQDAVSDLGALAGEMELSVQAGQVRVKLIRSWRKAKSGTGEPTPVAGWLAISEVGGKINYAWK